MRKKRGQQSAAGASILLVVIAVMVLLYIVLLPDADRDALLGGPGVPGAPGGPGVAPKNVLLSQSPGQINPPAPNEVEHSLPSFTIFTKTNAMELERKPSLSIKNGILTDSIERMSFSYNPSNTEDLMLSFNVKKTSGNLIIRLNGDVIFNSEINSGSPPPINLPESMLEATNTLEFEASSPGIAFWRVNTHDLVNVIVSGEVTDRSGSTADQHFSLPLREYEAMEFAELSFLPNCDPEFTGRLRVTVNYQEVFSGLADCGVPNKIEIAKDLLEPGDNVVRFVSQQGQYLVDLAKVTTRISGQEIPVFYFNIPDPLYDVLYFNDALLFVTLRFSEARAPKLGVLNVNGFESTFNTQDLTYQTQVNPEFLMPGPNSIMLIPQGEPLNVVELRVEVG